jgi:hypothetical protein
MIRKTLLVLSSIALFASCDNDLQIIADWKDVPVVYGILNAEDSVHYIKLNKAFLGRGDVMMMAQEFDSLHYAGEDVGLRLLEQEKAWIPSQNGEGWLTISTIELEPTDEFEKPEGAFSSPTQIIYKSSAQINAEALYSAEVYRKSNDTLIAFTQNPITILSPVKITRPNSFSPLTITPNGYVPKVEWKSVSGGDMYELSMNFNYIEFPNSIQVPVSGEADTISIEFNFQSRLSSNSNGGDQMSHSIDFYQFLNFIASNIPEDPTVRRLVVGMEAAQVVSGFAITHACLEFTLLAAGEDLSTYLVLNQNSSSLVLDRPEYSNIENGIGILSSRTFHIVENVKITNSSNDEIATNDVTKHLNFGSFQLNGDNEIEISYGN